MCVVNQPASGIMCVCGGGYYVGEITRLLGHNGAGKTMPLNILKGLTLYTSGTALIYGMVSTINLPLSYTTPISRWVRYQLRISHKSGHLPFGHRQLIGQQRLAGR